MNREKIITIFYSISLVVLIIILQFADNIWIQNMDCFTIFICLTSLFLNIRGIEQLYLYKIFIFIITTLLLIQIIYTPYVMLVVRPILNNFDKFVYIFNTYILLIIIRFTKFVPNGNLNNHDRESHMGIYTAINAVLKNELMSEPCTICNENGNPYYHTICNHDFCKECLDNWLLLNVTCPICREIIKDE